MLPARGGAERARRQRPLPPSQALFQKPQINGATAVYLFLPTFLPSFHLFSSLGWESGHGPALPKGGGKVGGLRGGCGFPPPPLYTFLGLDTRVAHPPSGAGVGEHAHTTHLSSYLPGPLPDCPGQSAGDLVGLPANTCTRTHAPSTVTEAEESHFLSPGFRRG